MQRPCCFALLALLVAKNATRIQVGVPYPCNAYEHETLTAVVSLLSKPRLGVARLQHNPGRKPSHASPPAPVYAACLVA